ncbi:signal peptide peptidase SppA [Kordiimonas aquimaris]|uniref:signal peptide peptidase SppA n=1 Tax=Kordiimonas aquimaris TaxID=707591 RepID=UPI0021CEBD3F|nr:signal peptide peptidase SppA [Kordiimonas aquimaris]
MQGVWVIIRSIGRFIMGLGSITLGLLVILMLAIVIMARTKEPLPPVPEGAVLVLWPEGQIVEQIEQPDAFEAALAEYNNAPAKTSIHDITTALKRAKNDDRISALALITESMIGAAPSHLHAMAAAIRDFKSTGKKVYALSAAYSQSDYLLAAEADKIYMNDQGSVLLSGYGQYNLYFKDLLEKIGANVHVFRVGTFKSAVEPYIRNDMSEAAKEANATFLGDLWRQYQQSVVSARDLPENALLESASDISARLRAANGDFATLAMNEGLVDELAPRAVWRQALMDEYGTNNNGTSFKQIHYMAYLAATAKQETNRNEVAVITAQGPIVMGDGPVTVAAAETLVGYIRSARLNSNTAAIVLRVDSPGGAQFASELIRQELVAAQEQGIKVIASMGPVAASGGYWIAATADEIWASPTTITGSIGIFAVIPTYENTLQKIGVSADGVGTTPLAGAFNLTRGMTDLTKDVLQQSIESGYGQFLELVARGRGMTVEDVDKIAQGRVWIGSTAQELGLVDHLGEFEDAVEAAATAAGVQGDYSTVFYRERPDQFAQMVANIFSSTVGVEIQDFMPKTQPSPLVKAALAVKEEAEFLLNLNDPMARYVICFECNVR